MELVIKINELIDLLDNSAVIREMMKYKELINHNPKLIELLNKFALAKEDYLVNPCNETQNELKIAKTNLYHNNIVKKYKLRENELFYLVLFINKELNKLTRHPLCQKFI